MSSEPLTVFTNRPVDPDTVIHSEALEYIGEIPVLIEHWSCDGISGTSFILPKTALPSLEEHTVLPLLRQRFEIGEHTFSCIPDGEFVFINTGFYAPND